MLKQSYLITIMRVHNNISKIIMGVLLVPLLLGCTATKYSSIHYMHIPLHRRSKCYGRIAVEDLVKHKKLYAYPPYIGVEVVEVPELCTDNIIVLKARLFAKHDINAYSRELVDSLIGQCTDTIPSQFREVSHSLLCWYDPTLPLTQEMVNALARYDKIIEPKERELAAILEEDIKKASLMNDQSASAELLSELFSNLRCEIWSSHPEVYYVFYPGSNRYKRIKLIVEDSNQLKMIIHDH